MVAPGSDLESIFRQVCAWPAGDRLTLARRLLESITTASEPTERRGYSAAEAMALVNSRQPAPSDETVRLWIAEHRSKKYDR
jgi:hypothetical protein